MKNGRTDEDGERKRSEEQRRKERKVGAGEEAELEKR